MTSVQKSMYNNLDYHILIMKALVDNNNEVTDEIKQDNDELKKNEQT